MAGKKRDRRRYAQHPKYREALALKQAARTALRLARSNNDPQLIDAAEADLSHANTLMSEANGEIFDRLLELRAATMQHAVEEIIKVASQRRYIVRQHHADILLGAMETSLEELRVTLTAALTRTTTTTRRRVVFRAEPLKPMKINAEAFMRG
jgi:hypothetical protein